MDAKEWFFRKKAKVSSNTSNVLDEIRKSKERQQQVYDAFKGKKSKTTSGLSQFASWIGEGAKEMGKNAAYHSQNTSLSGMGGLGFDPITGERYKRKRR